LLEGGAVAQFLVERRMADGRPPQQHPMRGVVRRCHQARQQVYRSGMLDAEAGGLVDRLIHRVLDGGRESRQSPRPPAPAGAYLLRPEVCGVAQHGVGLERHILVEGLLPCGPGRWRRVGHPRATLTHGAPHLGPGRRNPFPGRADPHRRVAHHQVRADLGDAGAAGPPVRLGQRPMKRHARLLDHCHLPNALIVPGSRLSTSPRARTTTNAGTSRMTG